MARMVEEVDVSVGLEGEMEGTEVRAWCYSRFSLVGGKRKHVPDVHQRMCTRSDTGQRMCTRECAPQHARGPTRVILMHLQLFG